MIKKYCAAPWRGLHINPQGEVKTCCAGLHEYLGDLGNLNKHTIQDVIYSDKLNEVRDLMKQGILHPEYCSSCIEVEKAGDSERMWHNRINQDFDPITANNSDFIPKLVDVRWNTTCNLSCKYCDSFCSSKWASLKKEYVDTGLKNYYLNIVNFIKKHKHNIKELALVGGEPLLLKENVALLQEIPDTCLVTIISNCSIDLENNKVFDELKKRKNVSWSISFDNIGERLEYVRHGVKSDNFDKNLKCITDLVQTNKQSASIHAVYNIYSCTRLCELREYANTHNLNINWQILYHPGYLSPANHCREVKELAINEIEKYIKRYLCKNNHPQLQQILSNLKNNINNSSDAQKEFIRHTEKMEKKYHSKYPKTFAMLWPELSMLSR
jgi:radical SAM protein with 4Fe4S-binding SPASM domain